MRTGKKWIVGLTVVVVGAIFAGIWYNTKPSGVSGVATTPSPSEVITHAPQPTSSNTAIPPATALLQTTPEQRTLIWADEFNGNAGTLPNPSRWNMDIGGSGWGNGEWQYYTGLADNVAQDGLGHLMITARRPSSHGGACDFGPCDITSGRIQTQGLFAGTHGRFEARIKVPSGLGLWPAFWLLPEDDIGEIDIMESYGREPSIISGTLHGPGTETSGGLSTQLELLPGNMTDIFHVYAVDWTAADITWSVDGHIFQAIHRTDPRLTRWIYDKPFYILLNLAVGSEDSGYPDTTTPFPAQMVIDYVRVYR